ncbi:MAG: nucleotidyltransferase domain-containing protein [Candidatus Roizmanbacteria bacterium]|nr:nucleotidyltransferase domain-containing protein [Candidatus Roizmanbacteria bacterium]
MDKLAIKTIPILKKYGVIRASFFGSMVRGDANKKSDLDILVELPKNLHGFDYIKVRLDIREELEKKLNKKVDLVEFETIKPSLKKYILSNQTPIYSQ